MLDGRGQLNKLQLFELQNHTSNNLLKELREIFIILQPCVEIFHSYSHNLKSDFTRLGMIFCELYTLHKVATHNCHVTKSGTKSIWSNKTKVPRCDATPICLTVKIPTSLGGGGIRQGKKICGPGFLWSKWQPCGTVLTSALPQRMRKECIPFSSPGDSGPCPTLLTKGGKEKQQIWLLGGLAEKLFTSRCFVIGVTNFYVVQVGFHCPMDSKKPRVTCSSLCCVLGGFPTSTVMLCTTVQGWVHNHCRPQQQLGKLYIYFISKGQHTANKPSKATGQVHQAMLCPPGDHGMEKNDDQRKSIQNALPMAKEMWNFRFQQRFQRRNASM